MTAKVTVKPAEETKEPELPGIPPVAEVLRPEEATYELEADHSLVQGYLEKGTLVGAGTAYPLIDGLGRPLPPSTFMKPLNEMAEKVLEARKNRVRDPVETLSLKI